MLQRFLVLIPLCLPILDFITDHLFAGIIQMDHSTRSVLDRTILNTSYTKMILKINIKIIFKVCISISEQCYGRPRLASDRSDWMGIGLKSRRRASPYR